MHSVTEMIVRIADLAEAEGRTLRAMAVRVALGVSIIIVAAGAVLAGVALILSAVFIMTADRTGPAAGAALTGLLALCIGGVLIWLGRRMGT